MNSAAGERREIEYAVHGGVSLKGHLYAPKGPGKFPAVIAVHGGGWRPPHLENYRTPRPRLAQRGHPVRAATPRLSQPAGKGYPATGPAARGAGPFAKGNTPERRRQPA